LKGTSVGFSFLTLVILFVTVVGHIVGVIGLVLDQATVSDFYFATPISILIVLSNALIVFGLKQNKYWAYALACLEMLLFIIFAIMKVWTTDLSSIFFGLILLAFSVFTLATLRNEFKNIEASEEPNV
jgi:uncharacterized membrane protein